VEDIRLIRDQRTQKSKGLAYVEFWEKEAVTKAVSLTGQLVNNFPITVQVTQSEKNKPPPDLEDGSTMRLYVGQLHQSVSEGDLRPVFEAFGPLEFVDLHKDPGGASRGFGFVQYKKAADAKQALAALNGLEIAGKAIKVGLVDQRQDNVTSLGELDDGNGVALTAQSRAALMTKLGRGTFMPGIQQLDAGLSLIPGLLPQPGAPSISAPMIQPTTCVVVKNMFDPKTETEGFEHDIREDVEEECKQFGRIKHIFVDKSSAQGVVYLRFDSISAAQQCIKQFNGRWFASRQISADFVADSLYLLKFPKSQ
jgi:RNA-binding protein 39